MKIILLVIVAAIAFAFAAGCGGEDICGVTSEGNKICGDDAAAWCMLSSTDWPEGDEGTARLCNGLARAGYRELQHRCIGIPEVTGDVKAIRAAVRNCAPAD